jgi:hypothetical protein
VSSNLDVLKGRKFAVLALPESRSGPSPASVVDLGDGFAVSSALPDGSLRTWQDQLGTIHRDELDKCNLFLWALRASKAPQVLDRENVDLRKKVYQLYLGLLLSVPYMRHGRLTSLTGAATESATVRSLTWYPQTFYTVGSPLAPITIRRLRDAAEIAKALRRHSRVATHRMVRSLRAFRQATESPELDIRLHQFVRAIDAFLAPPFGKSAVRFGERFAAINGDRGRAVAKECYEIRSAIEHLRGPYDGMRLHPRGGRHRRLVRRTIEAETIARYLLFTYFAHRELWPRLRSRTSVDELWHHGAYELKEACGKGIPLRKVAAAIDWVEVARHSSRKD